MGLRLVVLRLLRQRRVALRDARCEAVVAAYGDEPRLAAFAARLERDFEALLAIDAFLLRRVDASASYVETDGTPPPTLCQELGPPEQGR